MGVNHDDPSGCPDQLCPIHRCPRWTYQHGAGCGRPAHLCECP